MHPKISMIISGFHFDALPELQVVEEEGIAPVGTTGKWQCLKCMKAFFDKSTASRHYNNKHQFNVPEICQFCKKQFKNKNSLHTHQRDSHGLSQKDLKNRVIPNFPVSQS